MRALQSGSGKEVWVFKKHFDCVRAVCVSDERVFTGGEDLDRFVLWDYLQQKRRVIG